MDLPIPAWTRLPGATCTVLFALLLAGCSGIATDSAGVQPNLRAESVLTDPADPTEGANFEVLVNFLNSGADLGNTAFDIRMRIRDDLDLLVVEETRRFEGELTGDELVRVAFDVDGSLPLGDYTVRIEIDLDDEVNESDEDDNTTSHDFSITSDG